MEIFSFDDEKDETNPVFPLDPRLELALQMLESAKHLLLDGHCLLDVHRRSFTSHSALCLAIQEQYKHSVRNILSDRMDISGALRLLVVSGSWIRSGLGWPPMLAGLWQEQDYFYHHRTDARRVGHQYWIPNQYHTNSFGQTEDGYKQRQSDRQNDKSHGSPDSSLGWE